MVPFFRPFETSCQLILPAPRTKTHESVPALLDADPFPGPCTELLLPLPPPLLLR